MKKIILFIILFSLFAVSATAFEFNGTIYDPNGNVLEGVMVNLSNYTIGEFGPTKDSSINVTTNASGWFNLTMANNAEAQFKPIITYTNNTSNYVQYMGQTVPALPYFEFSTLAPINFYLKEAATMNITAINSTGHNITFGFIVKDTKLGYEVAMVTAASATGNLVYVPKNRNYSIMVWPASGSGNNFVPVSFEWSNFSQTDSETFGISSFNNTSVTLHKQFNISESYARITGYINGSNQGVEEWDNITIVPYLLEPSGMLYASQGTLPYNTSAWNGMESDVYNKTSGFYNITLPYAEQETVTYMLFSSGYNNTTYLGSYRNITVTGDLDDFNFTMYGLLGDVSNISMSDSMGGANWAVWTKKLQFNLINTSNVTISSLTAHTETKVDYSNYGSREFTFMNDISGTVGNYSIALLNVTGIKEVNVYSGNYAPKSVRDKSVVQLNNGSNNITLKSFQPGGEGIPGQDAIASGDITMALYKSNSTCDLPNPNSKCDFSSSESLSTFNPMKFLIGGGAISFRMGKDGVLVHYVNADLLASGPPDALFEDNSGVTGSGTSFDAALRFGSNGPSIYDYVIISIPYSETAGSGLDDSQEVTLSVANLYDDDWNVIWDVSVNGTNGSQLAGNFSHYNTFQNDWEILMGNNTCTTGTLTASSQLNVSNPCYIDTTNNRVWVRLPHFSGTGPSVSGTTTAAAAAAAAATSSTSSTTGTGSSVIQEVTGQYKKELWTTIKPGVTNTMTVTVSGISSVDFVTTKELWNPWVKVANVDENPTGISEFPRKVHEMVAITKSIPFKDQYLESAKINFEVPKSWLVDNELRKESIAMFHYVGEEWIELPTTFVEEKGDSFTYFATTKGFSYFVIGQKEKVEAPVTEEAASVTGDNPAIEGTPAVEGLPSEAPVWPWLVVALVVVAIIVVTWLVKRK